ncbi:MAG: PadR family transcriptional regulator [Pseudomonadota bacterium]
MARKRKLSEKARLVLAVMLRSAGRWSHGYDLSKETGVRSGTLYPLLLRLEEQGYLEAQWQEATERGRPPRHAYRLTDAGVELARQNPPELPSNNALARARPAR